MTDLKARLDEALVARGLAPSRSRARDQILRGCVQVAGETQTRPGRRVAVDDPVTVDDPAAGYVSRAALKLIAGLDAAGFDVSASSALDVGASTGGFTQVLLQRGARQVTAIDVGHGQLAALLRDDPRVITVERTNVRDLVPGGLPYAPDLITVDVSFVSLKLILPAVLALAAPQARAVILFKPQFEVGPEALGKGGIVRDEAAIAAALERIRSAISGAGWAIVAECLSPITGGDGNQERLIAARRGGEPGDTP